MKNRRTFFIYLVTIIFLVGCKSQRNTGVKFQQQERAPQNLVGVSKALDNILKSIEKVEKALEAPETVIKMDKKNEEKSSEGTSTSSETDKKNKENQESKKGETGSKSSNIDEILLEEWKKVDKELENAHRLWNAFEVEGMKKGVTKERADKFEESLNFFTTAIEKRNIIDIYDYGSQSMSNLGPMYDLYRDEIKGEISRIKYAAHQCYLRASQGRIEESLTLLNGTEEYINIMRQKIGTDNVKIKALDKVVLSIGDMRSSLKENSIKLFRIKKDIIIKNLEDLEK
ncbi:hypothetical protein KQI42_18420 [Tissierella sp. MSJ-40]|uniref:Lipoprotein n=1 Tax=Tissierella simiarum TaxID=2841534 RepID=A0ABS6ECT5_9FIRM|nr:hypothetical protein [Tissierella simiarum]MBU5439988.1 hypothetical protein [Tissierella simiarum]